MFRIIASFCMAVWLLFSAALAQGPELPEGVIRDVSEETESGYEIMDYYLPDDRTCFVLLRAPWNDQMLCLYEKESSQWYHRWNNELLSSPEVFSFTPEEDSGFTLSVLEGSQELMIRFEKQEDSWDVAQVRSEAKQMEARLFSGWNNEVTYYTNRRMG